MTALALGAQRGSVLWLILRQVAAITAVGPAAGVALAMWAGKFISAFLFGVSPADPSSLAVGAVTVAVVAGLAGYLPARRVARLDPLAALRVE